MKVKLLKKLRKKFKIEYVPILKQYRIIGPSRRPYYVTAESTAKWEMRMDMKRYGVKNYLRYARKIIVKTK